ncbi:Peptide synthetase [Penicillium capsulatum]|nr:Peptide synthetase [Penicillium capsulatum]
MMDDIWKKNACIPEPVNECVHDVISRRAQAQLNAPAVFISSGRTLFYRDLEVLSDRLAQQLSRFILPGAIVPLCFEKSRWTPVAMLAVLKAGGAFTLLDTSQPEDRLKMIIEQTRAGLICCSSTSRNIGKRLLGVSEPDSLDIDMTVVQTTTDDDKDIFTLIPSSPELHQKNGSNGQFPRTTPQSPCYVVFTSGSTGTPKGAVLSHSNICSAFHYQLDHLGFTPQSRVFDFASHAFDVAVHNMLATLVVGGCLCVPTENERLQDPAGAMAAMKVTLANLTPSVARLISPSRIPSLQTLLFLGETLTQAEAQRWTTSGRKLRVINTYGPAECTPISTINVPMTVQENTKNIGIGVGMGVLCWVADTDDSDNLVSPGDVGELLLEGPLVGMGYLNDPEKTAKAFMSNPKWLRSIRPSSCLYRTGDLVQQNEDGSFLFMGRKDTQVKISGQRVELGEIEYHVQICFPSVVQAVVDTVLSSIGLSLVAFVQLSEITGHDLEQTTGMKITHPSDEFIKYDRQISRRLPGYMTPNVYILVHSIPRTASGKTDRNSLKRGGAQLLESHSVPSTINTKTQPTSDIEQIVQSLWSTVLQRPPKNFGLDDTFVAIGGNSLSAIQLVGEARKEGIQLRAADVINPHITLRQLAQSAIAATDEETLPRFSLIDHRDAIDVDEIASTCKIDATAIEDMYPCTPLQEGLFALTMQCPEDYILQMTLSLDGLDAKAMQSAWEMVYNASPILRARICQGNTGLFQVIVKKDAAPLQWTNTLNLQQYLQQDKMNPTEPGKPLARFAVIKENEDSIRQKWIVITLHHALYDAWSLDLMVKQAERIYLNHESSLSPAALPKSNFTSFLKYIGERKNDPATRSFWQETLEGVDFTPFPGAPKSQQQSRRTREKMQFCYKPERNIHRTSEATLSTLLRGALAILLSGHTASPDVVFGATVSGRTSSVTGIEEVVGPTISTVPIRVQLNSKKDITVSDFLRGLQAQASEMVPFEQIGLQQIAKFGKGPQEACDFQTLLVVQPEPQQKNEKNRVTWHLETEQLSTYALTLECFPCIDGSIRIEASYNSSTIDSWQLNKMLEQLGYIIGQLEDTRKACLSLDNVNLLPRHHRDAILNWNARVPARVERYIHGIIQEKASQNFFKSRAAICAWDGSLTYMELDQYSDRLATHLFHLGVGSGTLVPICFEKSVFSVIAMLAVLKSGAGFVPIEPSLPLTRRQTLMEETAARVMLTSQQHASLFDQFSDKKVLVLSWDSLREISMNEMQNIDHPRTNDKLPSQSVAYVMFTSGTTGRPKGVVIEHGAASSSCTAHGKALGFTHSTRTLQFSSYAFDACIGEIFTTLMFGGCICIPSDSDRQSRITEFINSMEVNWIFLTPTVAQLIEPAAVSCLRTIALGGEKVSPTDAERWRCDGRRVFFVYGPTECCVFCSTHDLAEDADSSFIGLPSGCVAWVVDPKDPNKLAPLGSIGELLIEGPILANGYLNEPEKSVSSFISDPRFLVQAGRQGKLYKTGDLVRYSPSSNDNRSRLKYIGRKDTQVKIRGQRLELAEVENHVRQCIPLAKRAIAEVISSSETISHEALVAFVEMQSPASLTKHPDFDGNGPAKILSLSPDTTQQIAQRLPGYMVPVLYIEVSGSMPQMISSGKVDRKALREVGRTLLSQHRTTMEAFAGEKRAPSNETERALQNLWSHVLNISHNNIGLDDNFFHLGGDSITTMKLVAESRKHSLTLAVTDVMKMPTIAAQARLQEQTNSAEATSSETKIEPFSLLPSIANLESICAKLGLNSELVEDVYPCSPLQEGIFALASKRPGDYILHNVLELPEDLRIDAFKAAWEETVRLTPILRTRIMSHAEFGLQQVVWREKPNWTLEENCSVEDYLQENKRVWMGLGQPLSRFAVLGSPDKPTYFVWSLHHVVYDGWSLSLMTELAARLYAKVDFPQDQRPFTAFIRYIQEQKGSATDSYWQRNLDGHEASPFPALPSHIREPMADSKHEQEVSSLTKKSTEISISTLLRAALALVISRHSGSSDVVFGATLSGRNAPVPGITDIVGPTIATVPIRICCREKEDTRTIVSWLRSLQQQATGMIPFEQTGLQNISHVSPDAQRGCQFQTLLVIQADDEPIVSSQHSPFGTWQTPDEQSEFATYALTLEYVPAARTRGKGMFRARFDSRVINAWTVKRLLGQWDHVARQLIAATSQDSDSQSNFSIFDIDLLPLQDRSLLKEWNIMSPTPVAVDRCVHTIITEQGRTRQTETAIDGWDAQLTFAELDTLTDQLAEHLLYLGVGPEVFVPLCFPKSAWTIVAMLGVLKAGGAFVLLDPNHPIERLRMLCEKTRATVAIASSQSTAGKMESFVDTILIVDKNIAIAGWQPPIINHLSPQASPPASNAPSSSSSMQLVSPSNTAYVIFTSGSTGAPKGCKIEHRSYCSAAVYHGSDLQMSIHTRTLQFGSYSFAGAIMEILMTLIHGGCVCIPSEEERSPAFLAHAIQRLNANWAFLTSSVLSALQPEMVPCLRTVCVGGEAVHASQIALWSGRVHLRQTYGSAETSAVVSSAHLTAGATTGEVGRPTTGRYWIVDPVDVNQLAPMGAVGEVIIESPTIGREYLDEPEKTAAAFIQPPPWRKSLLVKLRGQRIELGEIEHQVRLASDLVKEVAVEISVPKDSVGEANSAVLVAFFVLEEQNKNGDPMSDQESAGGIVKNIPRQLQHVLPQYMVPSAFIVLLEMPKTISKKTDRRKLREMIASYQRDELVRMSASAGDSASKRPPTTERESILLRIWSQILGINPTQIGIDDDFFQLGGDSVSALRLVAEYRRAGLVLSMSDVFTQRILSSLAHVATDSCPLARDLIEQFSLLGANNINLDELRDELAVSCGVESDQIEDAYPCTPLQEGLISLTLKNPGDYILQNVLEISENVRLEELEAAWQRTISAVPTLRTRIVQHPTLGPLQVVLNGDIEWQRVSGVGVLNSFLARDKISPIDFGLPLSRFTIVDDESGDQPLRLVWTVHHALYDGWSMPFVFEMVSKTYLSGVSPSRREFVPFVKYLQESKPEDARTYWQSTLTSSNSVAFPPLPTSTYRPTADNTTERDIDVHGVWSRPRITLSNLVRAALGILINHQTNTNDVIFGAVLSGRNAPVPGIESIVGPTTTTVPVRVEFPVAQSVDEYLYAIQKQSVDMIPFEQTGLQHIGRVSSNATDFQTLLVIHPASSKGRADVSTRNENFGTWKTSARQSGFTTYTLTLEFFLPAPEENKIHLKAFYDTSVISTWETAQFLDQFPGVLQQLIDASPTHTVSDIDVMTSQERAMIWTVNQSTPKSINRCVHELIHERVVLHPEIVALSAWDGEMTYQELDILSDRLARRLVTIYNSQSLAIVPLCFEKSMWTVVAMLASMKAGLTAVTMDITQPSDRLRAIVKQIGDSPLILASVDGERLAAQLLPDKPVLVVGSQTVRSSLEDPQQLPCINPCSPVCVVFTSGSSGLPKGAALTHANFSTGIHHQAKTFGHGPGARVFAFASYSFDISWFDTLHALASGSTLCIPSEAQRKDDLEGSLARSGATVAFMTPSVARLLRPSAVPNLRLLALGGEPQRWADFREWPEHVVKLSVYGPAECTVVSAAEDARRNLQSRDFTLPSGSSMGLNTWLVDPTNPNLLAPLGATGEIWLEGPLVGAGYVGDEAKTAAAFVEDPLWLLKGGGASHLPGRRGRLYKTGDMGRYNADGQIYFMGRKDTQVKIRGQRVELAEIEHHVSHVMTQRNEKPSQVVAEIITLADKGDSGPILVAFVEQENPNGVHRGAHHHDMSHLTTHQSEPVAALMAIESEIVDELLLRLPSYMVPMVYFSIPTVPRTVNGKTDRKKLRQMGSELSRQQLTEKVSASGKTKTQPGSITESCLQQLWAQVLLLHPGSIGVHDNFFQIGGDSIAAMRLVGLARTQGIATLTVAEIFRLPLLRDQAKAHSFVQSESSHLNEEAAPFSLLPSFIDRSAICKELAKSFEIVNPIQDLYPCTPLQEGLFALTSKNAGGYVMQSVMELPASSTFNLLAFKAAWEETFHATDILRTRIVDHRELGLIQLVIQQNSVDWFDSPTETVESYLSRDKLAPMEFGMPLTRFALVGAHENGNPRWFVWTAHHCLYDGWSLSAISDKAATTYECFIDASQKKHDLPAVKFNAFVQYVEHQKANDQAKSFWRDTLDRKICDEEATFPSLPASVSQPMANYTLQQSCAFNTSTSRTSITLSTLVRAALALTLSQHTGVPEAIFGAIVSGRNAPVCDIEHIVGPTIATVPLRIPVPGKSRISDYLSQVQNQATEMIPYEQTGLRVISKSSEIARQACNFQTLLVVQPPSSSEGAKQLKDYGIWRTDINQHGFTTYALTIECTPRQDGAGLAFRATFDDRIVEPWQIERLLDQLSFLMLQLSAASPDDLLAEMDILPPDDKETIWKWNATVPEGIDRCVHDIIFDVVHDQPNAQAVFAWDGIFTYEKLNDLADNLASNLLSAGVTAGMIVPLCFEKSKWTVVGVLGVLKAGATFVFLDVETQPETRLQAIIDQTNSTIICSSVKHQNLCHSFGATAVVVGPESFTTTSASLSQVNPASPLYLNFTSGSTGHPKGAIVSHRSFASALHHQLSALNITRNTRLYDFASYSFDVSIHNILATLSAGGCLCVPSDTDRKTRLVESMEEFQANYIDLTASVSRLITPQDVPTLRTLTFGGEPVSQDDAERWWGKVHLINSCGPSECTPMSVINDRPKTPTALRRIGLGTGMLTWIVDPADHHRLLPIGQVGELILEGPLLGSGYLHDSARTKAAFIDPPRWLSERRKCPGKVYKTGDLVRYHPDGSLQILGRKDTQVKVRGQRVELEEVEQHLRRLLPKNAKVVAEAVPMKPSTTLIAFICLQTEVTMEAPRLDETNKSLVSTMAPELAEQASRSLPPYMVPSLYVPLAAMPMSVTGKTNRKELRALALSFSREQIEQMRGSTANEKPRRAPETEMQRRLQRLWAQILQLPRDTIGLDDSFVGLGGDSITAMQLVGEARRERLQLSVADIFRERTIFNLCQHILVVVEDHNDIFVPPKPYELVDITVKQTILSTISDQANICDILPTTDFQAESIAQPCNYFYLDLEDAPIDADWLQSSCETLLDHYPLLRSVFVQLERQYYQVVQKASTSFTTIDSDGPLDLACDTVCAQDIADGLFPNELFTKFFFVRSAKATKETTTSRLIIRLSHSQYDGFSLPMMLHTLVSIYDSRERATQAPSPFSSFAPYLAQLVRQRPQSRRHWERRLVGSRNTPISPILSQHVKNITSPLPRKSRKIHAESTVALPRELPEGVLHSTLLGSAWAVLLSLLTNREDVIFGHLVANRDLSLPGGSGHEIAGPCVNIIPVRVQVTLPSTSNPTSNIRAIPQSIRSQLLSLRETGLMMGYRDIIQSCTEWGSKHQGTYPILDSIVQHQNINENPEIEIAGVHAKLHWYENADVLPPVPLGLASHPIDGGSSLRIRVLSSNQYVTDDMAKCLVGFLCEMIDWFSRSGADSSGDGPAWEEFSAKVKANFSN